MHPEVEEYFKAKREALKERDDAIAEAEYVYAKATRDAKYAWESDPANADSAWDNYRENHTSGGLLRDANRVHTAAVAAADAKYNDGSPERVAKLRESKDLAVAWIANNSLREYPDYSAAVLKVLPVADTSILWEIKRQHGMCGEFDRLYARADAEGVFSGGKKSPGARELAALHNWLDRNYGERYARDMRAQMSTYIKAVREHYEKELADQKAQFELEKAQWQGLDEARRSEAARKAAATRAANREAADKAADETLDRVLAEASGASEFTDSPITAPHASPAPDDGINVASPEYAAITADTVMASIPLDVLSHDGHVQAMREIADREDGAETREAQAERVREELRTFVGVSS